MRNKKIFLIIFWAILLFSFLLRLLPTRNNNFYFTMDQGLDAVDSREIWARRQILLTGSPTAIVGLFTGPFWYYFVSLGYLIFNGHPFGPLFLHIFISSLLTALVMWKLAPLSFSLSLLTGISLQIFWPFFDTSRYSFNPFLLVILAYILIFLLIEAIEKKEKSFILAAIPVGLAFHSEVATFPVFLALYLLAGAWLLWRRLLLKKNFFISVLVISAFFIPTIIFEFSSNFSQTHVLINQFISKNDVVSGTNFNFISWKFLEMVGETTLPQTKTIGAIIFLALTFFFLSRKKINPLIKHFAILSLILTGLSFAWFASNKGWQTWHTVYLSPLLFTSLVILMLGSKSKIGLLFFSVIIFFQAIFFAKTYLEYFYPSSDPSLLINEIKAVDWVYQKSEGKEFYVYNYLPSVLDYPYQYLFWWYGRKKYGYLPCEFSSYPKAPKLFVRGREFYEKPKRDCSKAKLRFLIVEPDKNNFLRTNWINQLSQKTKLLDKTTCGKIEVEMLTLENN